MVIVFAFPSPVLSVYFIVFAFRVRIVLVALIASVILIACWLGGGIAFTVGTRFCLWVCIRVCEVCGLSVPKLLSIRWSCSHVAI